MIGWDARTMTSEYRHIPVLLPECMKYLKLSKGKTYVDATLGGAGHSLEAAKLIGFAAAVVLGVVLWCAKTVHVLPP